MLVRNSFAHLAARMASLLAGLIAIPLVTITSGTEALGLVGAYAALQAMLGLFDLGLPTAVNRRLAVLIVHKASASDQAQLIRSLEVLFWAMAILFLVAGLWFKAPLANSWFNVQVLSRDVVDTSLALIVIGIAVRFPVTYYCNVLFALDRHFFPNAVLTVFAVLRTGIAIVALTQFDVGVVGFFIVQLIANCAEVAALIVGVWRKNEYRFMWPDFKVFRQVAGMAGILSAISLTAVALSQVDKIVLSKILSLGDFGIYSAAYALAGGLLALSYPVGNSVFPQLNQSLDRGEYNTASGILRLASELTIFLVVPLGAVLAMQAGAALDVLFLNRQAPVELATILPLMMLGGIAQGFVTLPHLFQIAAARTAVVLYVNLAFIPPYAILMYAASMQWGLWGGAFAFAIFNIARLLAHWIVLSFGHRLSGAWRNIALQSASASIAALAAAWWAAPLAAGKWSGIAICVATVAALSSIFLVISPGLRARGRMALQRLASG